MFALSRRLLIIVGLAALLLTGCPSPDPTPTATPPSPTAVSEEIAPAAATDTSEAESSPTEPPVLIPTLTPTTAPTTTSVSSPTATSLPPPTATAAAVPTSAPAADVSGTLNVYYLDVGQGDSTLLMGPDFTFLIDAGRHNGSEVVPYLENFGVQSIDLLIGTHPHADHIGQMDKVIQRFPVTEVWMSGAETTSQTFERVLDAIIDSGADYYEPRAGEAYQIGSARIEIVHPSNLVGDANEDSIAVRIHFGDGTFLFTGDAETQSESAMLGRGHDLSADVLQLGHHGSSTSSTQAFLDVVRPEVAIWSAGMDNSYGHPHDEVIARLAQMDIATYGTAEHGTISVTTDGQSYDVLLNGARAPPVEQQPVDTAPQESTAQVAPAPQPTATFTPVPPADETGGCAPGQVDINTASHEELQRIHQIGPARADQILNLRPFSSVDDMVRISGIAEGRLAEIKAQGVACVN